MIDIIAPYIVISNHEDGHKKSIRIVLLIDHWCKFIKFNTLEVNKSYAVHLAQS